jgi:hypothetical protein
MAPIRFVRLVRIAERQHSVFTLAQALSCRLTEGEVRGLVRRGLSERVHRGVYRLRGSVVTFGGAWSPPSSPPDPARSRRT